VAAGPGLGALTAGGASHHLTPHQQGVNGVPPITAAAAGGFNAAAAQAAAINAVAAVSAGALHHNATGAILSPTNHHQHLSVHHPAISPHLPPQHIAAGGPPVGVTVANQQLSTPLGCQFTSAVDGGGTAVGSAAVVAAAAAAANTLQQQQQHRHHSSQNNPNQQQHINIQKNNTLQHAHQQTCSSNNHPPAATLFSSGGNQQLAATTASSSGAPHTLIGQTPIGGGKLQHQSSPAPPKKFRPSYTRPSNKGARYVPKPMPQELSNLKTYSKNEHPY